MFGKKAQMLNEAEDTIRQLKEQVDRDRRQYEKQQGYIEGLYDLVADLSRMLGSALQKENLERLQNNRFLDENSSFFLDLHTLFSTKVTKGTNVTCFFGKDQIEIRKRFQERDFKNIKAPLLMEHFTSDDLRTLFREHMWKKSLVQGLLEIRSQKGLDRTL